MCADFAAGRILTAFVSVFTSANEGIVCLSQNCSSDTCEPSQLRCQAVAPEGLHNDHDKHFCAAMYGYNATGFHVTHLNCTFGKTVVLLHNQ